MEKDMARLREIIFNSERVTALTGAGISAESGVPTFRGEGGMWKTYQVTEVATPQAFASNPEMVWEFYNWSGPNGLRVDRPIRRNPPNAC